MSVGISAATASLIAAGVGAAGSVTGAALGSGSKTVNTTTTLPSNLQGAENTDLSTLNGILNSPSAGLEPVQGAAQDSINQSYAALPQEATQQLASRGFGSSGQVGNAVYDTEGARLGAQSSLAGQMAQLASSRQLSAAQIIQAMVAAGRGQSTTYPSNSLAAGLTTAASSLGSLSSLLTLQQMINGGGSGGSTPTGGVSPTVLLGSGATPGGSTTGDLGADPIDMSGAYGSETAMLSPDPSGAGWA